jgi:hypothetical protein
LGHFCSAGRDDGRELERAVLYFLRGCCVKK